MDSPISFMDGEGKMMISTIGSMTTLMEHSKENIDSTNNYAAMIF